MVGWGVSLGLPNWCLYRLVMARLPKYNNIGGLKMAKYYTIKLTEAQYFHVLDAMSCYGYDVSDNAEFDTDKRQLRLHERTRESLFKAQEKK